MTQNIVLTSLRAASEQTTQVCVLPQCLHHFHFFDQVHHFTVCCIICYRLPLQMPSNHQEHFIR